MRTRRSRRKDPTEKQKPFFDKQGTGPLFFGANQVQRKLSVGGKHDAAEKEAESTAQKIAQVQKAEKKEEEPVQKAEKKEEEKPVQKEDKKEEEKPAQKAEKKEEEKPVQKEDKKEEEKPAQKAEKKEEEKPVQKAEKKEEEKPVQKADDKKEEEPPVMTKQDPRVQRSTMPVDKEDADSSNPSFEERLKKRKGMGFALPDDLRKDMEAQFHTSFKDVRIHTDKEANEMCEAVHALAFAHGYDIYFNAGMYNPEAESGRELLAHELTHVVQQNG
jgi:hypothetical protein